MMNILSLLLIACLCTVPCQVVGDSPCDQSLLCPETICGCPAIYAPMAAMQDLRNPLQNGVIYVMHVTDQGDGTTKTTYDIVSAFTVRYKYYVGYGYNDQGEREVLGYTLARGVYPKVEAVSGMPQYDVQVTRTAYPFVTEWSCSPNSYWHHITIAGGTISLVYNGVFYHDVNGEVVSVDKKAETRTFYYSYSGE